MSSRPAGPGKVPASVDGVPGTSYDHTAEFPLSNYRMGKTLGIGSFGKVYAGL